MQPVSRYSEVVRSPSECNCSMSLCRASPPWVSYMNPTNPSADFELNAAQEGAKSLGMKMPVIRAGNETELQAVFASLPQRAFDTLLVASDSFFYARRELLVSLITKQHLPAVFYLREFADDGGLMAYGNKLPELYRLVGLYVGRILKGEKPAELPVQAPQVSSW